nr:PaaI family thioesterase [Stenotrophomonas pavanii]
MSSPPPSARGCAINPESIFYRVVNGDLPRSQAGTLLGWRFVDYDDARRRIQVEFEARPLLTNPMGNVQGGFLSAMLDDCMGPAIYATLPANRIAVTVESKTSFVSPARPGRIIGWGEVEHSKGSIAFTRGWLTDPTGKVLATASATFRVGALRWRGLSVPRPIARRMIARTLRRVHARIG